MAVQWDSEKGFNGVAVDVFDAVKNKILGIKKEIPEITDEVKDLLSCFQDDSFNTLSKDEMKNFFDDEELLKNLSELKESFMNFIDKVDLSGDVFAQYQEHLQQSSQSMTLFQRAGKAAGTAMRTFGATLASMGVAWLAGEALSLAITGIYDLATAAKTAKENSESLPSSLSKMQSKYAANSSKIDELSKKYDELSSGVNNAGLNVSLTSSQYDEYKSVIKQLSELMPELTTRFNEQGEAIGFVGGKLKDTKKKYQEYHRDQANKILSEGKDDKTYDDVIDNLNNQEELGSRDTPYQIFKFVLLQILFPLPFII